MPQRNTNRIPAPPSRPPARPGARLLATILASAIEPLETRRLLTAALRPTVPTPVSAPPITLPLKTVKITDNADAFITPSNYAAAYGLNNVSFNGVLGTGAGQTIAIIDAFDESGLVDTSAGAATFDSSDLGVFDSTYGFSSPPLFVKLNENGSSVATNLPPASNTGDAIETALDVEYAHAIAPDASIIVIECNSLSDADITTGINTARNIAGVSVISMSFGGGEDSFEADGFSGNGGFLDDGYFQTPSGHVPITFVASTGDAGYGTEYPSTSPDVVAVGGTVLSETGGVYGSETAWTYSSGGVSADEKQPSYQTGIDTAASTTARLVPDVSLDAGQPVVIYDTSNGEGGFLGVEGTSIAAPSLAGAIAIADQGRVLEGLGTLNSNTQTLPRIYELPASDYHDITTGSSGSGALAQAGPGYDLVTGIGSLVGNNWVPDLAGGLTVTGTVFADNNSNGTIDNGEQGIGGVRVYLDLNNSGTYVSGDPTGVTNANGVYSFSYDAPGGQHYVVREIAPAGFIPTAPAGITIASSYDATDVVNLGDFPKTFNTSNVYYVVVDPSSPDIDIFQSVSATGTPAFSIPKSLLGTTALSFQPPAGTDELIVDYANGDPMAASGQFSFTPASGSTSTLEVINTPAAATISVTAAGVVVNSQSITTSGVQTADIVATGAGSSLWANFTSNPFTTVTLDASANNDSITLSGNNTNATAVSYAFNGSGETLNVGVSNPYTITGDASQGLATGGLNLNDSSALTLIGSQNLAAIVINANASISIRRNGSAQSVIQATSLSINNTGAYLDLDNNVMIINYGNNPSPINTIQGYLETGSADGDWNGNGIRSTAAANDFTGTTAIGAIDNQQLLALQGNNYSTFAGVPVSQNSVLLKYTYYGDTNLDGRVDAVDVDNVIQGFEGFGSGWLYGDFNYDGAVNSLDITELIIGYSGQGKPL